MPSDISFGGQVPNDGDKNQGTQSNHNASTTSTTQATVPKDNGTTGNNSFDSNHPTGNSHLDADSGFSWDHPWIQGMLAVIDNKPVPDTNLPFGDALVADISQPFDPVAALSLQHGTKDYGTPPERIDQNLVADTLAKTSALDMSGYINQNFVPDTLAQNTALHMPEHAIMSQDMQTTTQTAAEFPISKNMTEVSTPPMQLQDSQKSTQLPSPPSEARPIATPCPKLKVGNGSPTKNDPKSVKNVFAKVHNRQQMPANSPTNLGSPRSAKRKQSVSTENSSAKKQRTVETLPTGDHQIQAPWAISQEKVHSKTPQSIAGKGHKSKKPKYEVVMHKGQAFAVMPLGKVGHGPGEINPDQLKMGINMPFTQSFNPMLRNQFGFPTMSNEQVQEVPMKTGAAPFQNPAYPIQYPMTPEQQLATAPQQLASPFQGYASPHNIHHQQGTQIPMNNTHYPTNALNYGSPNPIAPQGMHQALENRTQQKARQMAHENAMRKQQAQKAAARQKHEVEQEKLREQALLAAQKKQDLEKAEAEFQKHQAKMQKLRKEYNDSTQNRKQADEEDFNKRQQEHIFQMEQNQLRLQHAQAARRREQQIEEQHAEYYWQ